MVGIDEELPTLSRAPYDSLAILEFLDVDEQVAGRQWKSAQRRSDVDMHKLDSLVRVPH